MTPEERDRYYKEAVKYAKWKASIWYDDTKPTPKQSMDQEDMEAFAGWAVNEIEKGHDDNIVDLYTRFWRENILKKRWEL